ncbi:right-handed parallel beta-helix repeat-containing protein [Candidatus Woesearchaeota archaeon]|nr:right-handed parallel beta-helix repeat-containing protein [Candidatus Woesearchaeota archaeon]
MIARTAQSQARYLLITVVLILLVGAAALFTQWPITGHVVYQSQKPIDAILHFDKQAIPLGSVLHVDVGNQTLEKNVLSYLGSPTEVQYNGGIVYGFESSLDANLSSLGIYLDGGNYTITGSLLYDGIELDRTSLSIAVEEPQPPAGTPPAGTDETAINETATNGTAPADQPLAAPEAPQPTPAIAPTDEPIPPSDGQGGARVAVDMSCGQRVTNTTTLSSNVATCSADGLVIVANNVTLDCNGTDIVGDNTNISSAGIRIESRINVTIINCNTTDFGDGLVLNGTTNGTIFHSIFSSRRGFGMIITASKNITLNNITGRANTSYGINLANSSNMTFINVSGHSTSGIGFDIGSNTVSGNELRHNQFFNITGNSSSGVGLKIGNITNSTFVDCIANSSSQTALVVARAASYNNITRCTIETNTTSSHAMTITSNNNYFDSLTVIAIGTSGNALDVGNDSVNNTFINSVIDQRGTGIAFRLSGDINKNNTLVNVTTFTASGNGFNLESANNTSIISSKFNAGGNGTAMSGNARDNYFLNSIMNVTTDNAIRIGSSMNTTFVNTTTNATTGRSIFLITGTNDTVFSDLVIWGSFSISTDTLSNMTLTNVTFKNNNGSIHYARFNVTRSTSIDTAGHLNISFNRTFVNSTALSPLNTSATITLYNLSLAFNLSNITPFYDPEHDGTFVDCSATICTEDSFNTSTGDYTFNVTSFSSYAGSQEASCGSLVSTSRTLLSTIANCGASGLIIGGNNLVLDCNGFDIVGTNTNATSRGIDVQARNNITIRNCNVSWFGAGINFTAVTNSTIRETNISVNSSNGLYLDSTSRNNTLVNITARANASDAILLLGADNNSIIESEGHAAVNGVSLTANAILNRLLNVTGNSSTGAGILINTSDNTTLYNCRGNSSTGYGINIISPSSSPSNYNNLTGCLASSSAGKGVGINATNNNYFRNLTISNSTQGMEIGVLASNNTIVEAAVSGTTSDGFFLSGNNNTLINVTARSNTLHGIEVVFANNNTIISSRFHSTSGAAVNLSGQANDNYFNDTFANSSIGFGVAISSSNNNTFSDLSVNVTPPTDPNNDNAIAIGINNLANNTHFDGLLLGRSYHILALVNTNFTARNITLLSENITIWFNQFNHSTSVLGSFDSTARHLNMTKNVTFINTSYIAELTVGATLVFYQQPVLAGNNSLSALRDGDYSGAFFDCVGIFCTRNYYNIAQDNTTAVFSFNVSSFSSYTTSGEPRGPSLGASSSPPAYSGVYPAGWPVAPTFSVPPIPTKPSSSVLRIAVGAEGVKGESKNEQARTGKYTTAISFTGLLLGGRTLMKDGNIYQKPYLFSYDTQEFDMAFKNTADVPLHNVALRLETSANIDVLQITPEKISELAPGQEVTIHVSIKTKEIAPVEDIKLILESDEAYAEQSLSLTRRPDSEKPITKIGRFSVSLQTIGFFFLLGTPLLILLNWIMGQSLQNFTGVLAQVILRKALADEQSLLYLLRANTIGRYRRIYVMPHVYERYKAATRIIRPININALDSMAVARLSKENGISAHLASLILYGRKNILAQIKIGKPKIITAERIPMHGTEKLGNIADVVSPSDTFFTPFLEFRKNIFQRWRLLLRLFSSRQGKEEEQRKDHHKKIPPAVPVSAQSPGGHHVQPLPKVPALVHHAFQRIAAVEQRLKTVIQHAIARTMPPPSSHAIDRSIRKIGALGALSSSPGHLGMVEHGMVGKGMEERRAQRKHPAAGVLDIASSAIWSAASALFLVAARHNPHQLLKKWQAEKEVRNAIKKISELQPATARTSSKEAFFLSEQLERKQEEQEIRKEISKLNKEKAWWKASLAPLNKEIEGGMRTIEREMKKGGSSTAHEEIRDKAPNLATFINKKGGKRHDDRKNP